MTAYICNKSILDIDDWFKIEPSKKPPFYTETDLNDKQRAKVRMMIASGELKCTLRTRYGAVWESNPSKPVKNIINEYKSKYFTI